MIIQANIRRRAATLGRRAARVQEDRYLLQQECLHPTPFMKYGASTGNYDTSSDAYWIDWKCPDCGKQWHTDQSSASINAYPNAVNVTR